MSAPFFDAAFGWEARAAAVAIGLAFGWTLERAGLGDARKLAGQFYLTDLTVFKVMFSAVVTAMLGAFWLARFGILDLGRVAVPETYLLPQLAGGALFGAGFIAAGLCPGTSCVAAASGRGDGLMVMLGMFAGVLLTGLTFSRLQGFYESTAHGAWTLPQLLHLPYGVVVFGVVAMALIAFRAGNLVRPSSAASRHLLPPGEGSRYRRLAIVALAGGLLAAVPGSPYRAGEAEQLALAISQERDHVTAIELAQWIRDRKAGLRVIDLRSEVEFKSFHIPRSERMPIESIPKLAVDPRETLVLISDGGAHAAQGWVLLQTLGHRNVYFLRGGVREWLDDILRPAKPSELTRYFGGMPRGDGAPEGETSSDAALSAIRRRGC